MKYINKAIFLFFILILNRAGSADLPYNYKLLLTVFYESKCSDSRSFINRQLHPAVNMLHDYIMLDLVPFGKAESIDDGFGGFECQHGPSECMGNMVQDCTLNYMRNRTDTDKVNYVICEMDTLAGTVLNLECVKKSLVNPDVVSKCISHGKGTILQLDAEYKTSLVTPKFIPTVTINGVFNQNIQDSAMIDLVGTLCSILKDTPPCATMYNSMALKHILRHQGVPKRIPSGFSPYR